ncbi:MAG: hypothetical protein AAFX87_16940 [Bacteroidota bacterium]
MKRFICAIFLVGALVTVAHAQKKVAIVTFYVDKYFNADKIVESARQETNELTKKDDPRFDLRPILVDFHETFLKDYIKDFPFEILDEDKVLNHPKYLAYSGLDGVEDQDEKDNFQEMVTDRFIAIDGYKVLLTGGNLLRSWRTESHMVKILDDMDIDGVMFISMYYQWEPKVAFGGLGNAGIRAYINMELFNKDAKKVFKLDEYATSKKGVALVSGVPVMKYEKLLPMCQDASDRLMADLNKKLPKLVKKVDKKL